MLPELHLLLLPVKGVRPCLDDDVSESLVGSDHDPGDDQDLVPDLEHQSRSCTTLGVDPPPGIGFHCRVPSVLNGGGDPDPAYGDPEHPHSGNGGMIHQPLIGERVVLSLDLERGESPGIHQGFIVAVWRDVGEGNEPLIQVIGGEVIGQDTGTGEVLSVPVVLIVSILPPCLLDARTHSQGQS